MKQKLFDFTAMVNATEPKQPETKTPGKADKYQEFLRRDKEFRQEESLLIFRIGRSAIRLRRLEEQTLITELIEAERRKYEELFAKYNELNEQSVSMWQEIVSDPVIGPMLRNEQLPAEHILPQLKLYDNLNR